MNTTIRLTETERQKYDTLRLVNVIFPSHMTKEDHAELAFLIEKAKGNTVVVPIKFKE